MGFVGTFEPGYILGLVHTNIFFAEIIAQSITP